MAAICCLINPATVLVGGRLPTALVEQLASRVNALMQDQADVLPAIEVATSRWAELKALESEVADLGERLETRKAVERAKGLLMSVKKMSEPDAFRWIQRTAMDRRTTMKAVAEAVVEGLATPRT